MSACISKTVRELRSLLLLSDRERQEDLINVLRNGWNSNGNKSNGQDDEDKLDLFSIDRTGFMLPGNKSSVCYDLLALCSQTMYSSSFSENKGLAHL